jgi:phage-related protein
MNFYQGTELKNDTVSGDGFPTFVFGENTVAFDGGITSVEIIPRWKTV